MIGLLGLWLAGAALAQNAAPPTSSRPAPQPAAAATPAARPPAATPPATTSPSTAGAPPAAPPRAAPTTPPSADELLKAAIEKQRAAIAAQLEAIRKQAQLVGAHLTPWGPVTPPAPDLACDPLPEAVVAPLVEDAAKSTSLQPDLLRAVIEQESGYRACAVSPKGAEGLMQLMPQTIEELGVNDPFDPKENIDAGAKFLKQLLDAYKGDLPQALGAYNAGPAASAEDGNLPDIEETREYVDAILNKLGQEAHAPP